MKNDLIEEIVKLINNDKKLKDIYKSFMISFLENYRKFNADVVIDDYYLSNKSHYLSFKMGEKGDLVYIDLTNKYIELRFLHYEQQFFFDNELFIKSSKELLKSFFKGEYEIKIYTDNEKGCVFKEINWKKENLVPFNEKYKLGSKKDYVEIKRLNGVKYIN